MLTQRKFSRRKFLELAALSTAGAFLAACGTPAAEEVPEEGAEEEPGTTEVGAPTG